MQPSGLAKKLGIKPEMRVLLINAPQDFPTQIGTLPDGAKVLASSKGKVDCVIGFVRSTSDVDDTAEKAINLLNEDGLLWFAYPKKSGRLKSDISRDKGWQPVLERGFDSVAQISIDEDWTGFRFRRRQLIGK